MQVRELIQELLKYDISKEIKIISPENGFLDIYYIAFNKPQNKIHINTSKEA